MLKFFSHIHSLRAVVFSLLLFVFLITVRAQHADTTGVTDLDTLTEAPAVNFTDTVRNATATTTDSSTYFDIPTEAEKAPVKHRRIPDSALQNLYDDEAFWYVNEKPNRRDEKPSFSFFEWLGKHAWFRTVLWCVIVGSFVAILIWFLAAGQTGLFRKKPLAMPAGEEETLPNDIFAIDFAKELNHALESKNYRLVIRLMYLQLLKDLAQKNILQYKQEKPNSDYVYQLSRTPYYNGFLRLTRHFEYTWYGQFDLPEPAFERLRNDFIAFKQQLPA